MRISLVFTCIFTITFCVGAYADSATIPLMKNDPVIDGVVAPVEQSESLQMNLVKADGGTLSNPTEVFVGRSGDNLYIGFKCHEKDMKHLPLQWKNPEERDNSVWTDDCVEIYVDPVNGDPLQVRHIIINSAGVIYDEAAGSSSWDCSVKAAAVRGEDSWTVEAEIPLADLGCSPKGPETWNFNFARIKNSPQTFLPLEVSSLKAGPTMMLKDPSHFMPFRFASGENYPLVVESLGGGASPEAKILFGNGNGFRVELSSVGLDGKVSLLKKADSAPSATAVVAYPKTKGSSAILLKVFEKDSSNILYENRTELVGAADAKALAGRTQNPLFKELLGDEPAGLAKNGTLMWIHGLVEFFMRPFALQYGFRYSVAEMNKLFVDEKFIVIVPASVVLNENFYYKNGIKEDMKFAVYPLLRKTPFLLDPAVQEKYLEDIRKLTPYRDHIAVIFWGDEMNESIEKQAIELFQKTTNPDSFIRKADAEVREKYGFGKYGIPESAGDNNPYRWIAFRKWENDTLVNFFKRAYKEVKTLYPGVLVVSDDPTARQDMIYGYSDYDGVCDIITHQLYPWKNADLEEFGFLTKYIRDLSGMKEIWPVPHVEEYGCSYTPEDVLEKLSETVRCGATGLHYWLNDSVGLRSGKKYLHFEYYGAPDRWQIEVAVAEELGKMNRLRFPDADCAVFAPETSVRAYTGLNHILHKALCLHSYIARGTGAWYKFINEGTMSKDSNLQKYKVIMTADSKYVTADAFKKLKDYVAAGGVLLLLDPEAFSFSSTGNSLASERAAFSGVAALKQGKSEANFVAGKYDLSSRGVALFDITPAAGAKVIARFPSGRPAMIENSFGKGKVVTFAVNPCHVRLAGDVGWKAFLKEYLENSGVKTDQDIWRFRFPKSMIKAIPGPEGLCLTGNYTQWRSFKPVIDANIVTDGTYSCDPAPDSPAESGASVAFAKGHLTDRLTAIYGGNVDLGKSKISQWTSGWKTAKPISITFDFKKQYPIDRIVLYYQKYLRNITVGVSEDAKNWTEAKFPLLASDNLNGEDVFDKVLKLPDAQDGRFVRISFDAPVSAEKSQLILGEVEVWTK